MEATAVQPMPTKRSPIIYPQLSANEDRNGVTKGTKLLGTDGWAASNQYTSNKVENKKTGITGGTAGEVDGTIGLPNAKGTATKVTMTKVDIVVTASDGVGSSVYRGVVMPASGNVTVASGIATSSGAYDVALSSAGKVTVTPTGVAPETLTCKVLSYYDLNQVDPAQVVFTWEDKVIEAEPRRIRSTYDLDNFYGAAKTLAGQNFDLDKVLATTMAGYINKEISCDIFDNILDQAGECYEWDSTPAANTEWYWHQASVLGPLNLASNKIRDDIARSAGNIIIADTKLQTVFENIGGTMGGASVPNPGMWSPQSYASQPIGPYVSGIFGGKYKVIFNQDFPTGKSCMLYKKDDLDAAYFVGVFLGLYATNPLGLDDLSVRQGMGCQLGEVCAFPSAIKEISVIAS